MSEFWLEWLPREEEAAGDVPVPMLETLPGKLHVTDPLDRGLVGEWRFDRDTGLVLPDYSGNAHHGTITPGTGGWVSTRYGPALDCDSANTKVETGFTTHPSGAVSYEFMFEVDSMGESSLGRIADKNSNIIIYTLQNKLWFEFNYSVQRGIWDAPISINTLYHYVITLVIDGSSDAIYYQNGTLQTVNQSQAPNGAAVTDSAGYVLGNRTNQQRTLDGRLALFKIYNRILSLSEARRRYEICTARASGAGAVHILSISAGVTDLGISVSDSVVVGEATTLSHVPYNVSESDALTIGDAQTLAMSDVGVSTSDALTVEEGDALYTDDVQLGESVAISVYTPSADLEIGKSDSITVSESLVITIGDLTVSELDAAAISESVSVTIGDLVVSESDAVAVGEAIIVTISDVAISESDGVTVSDSQALAVGDLVVSESDGVTVGEYVELSLPELGAISVGESDAITVSDSATLAMADMEIGRTDGMVVDDDPTVGISGVDLAIAVVTSDEDYWLPGIRIVTP